MMAAHYGHHECVSILVAHGADVSHSESVCCTVCLDVRGVSLRLNDGHCSWHYVPVVTIVAFCEELLSVCHWNEQNGDTALMLAASEGHHECVSILVANGADVNMATEVTD